VEASSVYVTFQFTLAFFIPGATLFLISMASYAALLYGPVKIGAVIFDVHTLFFAESGLVLGFLAAALGVVIRLFGIREGLLQENSLLEKLKTSPVLEIGSAVGILMMLGGLFLGFDALKAWNAANFGPLSPGALLRTISFSTTMVMLGGVTLMASLIMGFLSLPTREKRSWVRRRLSSICNSIVHNATLQNSTLQL